MKNHFLVIIGLIILVAVISVIWLSVSNRPMACPDDVHINFPETLEVGEVFFCYFPSEIAWDEEKIIWRVDNREITNGVEMKYLFEHAGEYTLEASLGPNCSFSKEITVSEFIEYDTISPPQGIAEFDSKTRVLVGEEISFNDKSENAQSWFWNFDDGFSSAKPNPKHIFRKAGSFKVVLQINDDENLTYTKEITVSERPVAKNDNPAPPVPKKTSLPSNVDEIIQIQLQKIASAKTPPQEKNFIYKNIEKYLSESTIAVKIKEGNKERQEDFFSYFQELNIEGGQSIIKVVSKKNAAGKIASIEVWQKN